MGFGDSGANSKPEGSKDSTRYVIDDPSMATIRPTNVPTFGAHVVAEAGNEKTIRAVAARTLPRTTAFKRVRIFLRRLDRRPGFPQRPSDRYTAFTSSSLRG